MTTRVILLTGASGRIGRTFFAVTQKNYVVFLGDRKESTPDAPAGTGKKDNSGRHLLIPVMQNKR